MSRIFEEVKVIVNVTGPPRRPLLLRWIPGAWCVLCWQSQTGGASNRGCNRDDRGLKEI